MDLFDYLDRVDMGEADRMADEERGKRVTEEERNQREIDLQFAVSNLKTWWGTLSAQDADKTAPKAVEYGAVDLDIMGQAMVSLGGDLWNGASQEEKLAIGREMACAFYALGKVSRVFSAFQQGRAPSDDTWLDITVYSVMARRIRQTGEWP